MFFDVRREIPSFYADFSICPKSRVAPATRPQRASDSQLSSPGGKTQLTDFSQISQNPPRTLPVHDVIHIHWSTYRFGIFILTSVNDTSSPRACQHLRSSLHLTNQCAKRKVFSLTKPKGRIYKTKSLGHYITIILK